MDVTDSGWLGGLLAEREEYMMVVLAERSKRGQAPNSLQPADGITYLTTPDTCRIRSNAQLRWWWIWIRRGTYRKGQPTIWRGGR